MMLVVPVGSFLVVVYLSDSDLTRLGGTPGLERLVEVVAGVCAGHVEAVPARRRGVLLVFVSLVDERLSARRILVIAAACPRRSCEGGEGVVRCSANRVMRGVVLRTRKRCP